MHVYMTSTLVRQASNNVRESSATSPGSTRAAASHFSRRYFRNLVSSGLRASRDNAILLCSFSRVLNFLYWTAPNTTLPACVILREKLDHKCYIWFANGCVGWGRCVNFYDSQRENGIFWTYVIYIIRCYKNIVIERKVLISKAIFLFSEIRPRVLRNHIKLTLQADAAASCYFC